MYNSSKWEFVDYMYDAILEEVHVVVFRNDKTFETVYIPCKILIHDTELVELVEKKFKDSFEGMKQMINLDVTSILAN